MTITSLLLAILFGSLLVFAAVNWEQFLAQTTLSLVFTEVQAPLGIVMLGVVAAVLVVCLAFVAWLQTGALLEGRRHTKELQAQRDLADRAEASRFSELRAHLDAELGKLAAQISAQRDAQQASADALEQRLRAFVEQHSNSLAAQIAEFEDRFERGPFRG